MANPLDVDRNDAYDCWLDSGRNVSLTARRLSVNRTSVQRWKQVDDWDRRYLEGLTTNNRSTLELARLDVAEAIQAGIPEMREIVLNRATGEDDKGRPYYLTADKDRVNAFRALVEAEKALQLLDRADRQAVSVIDIYHRRDAGADGRPESMLDAASRILEANVAASSR